MLPLWELVQAARAQCLASAVLFGAGLPGGQQACEPAEVVSQEPRLLPWRRLREDGSGVASAASRVTEGPGILNWCIEGAVHLLVELQEHGRIQLTEAQKQRVDALLCESDSVRHFVTKCVAADPAGDVTVAELLTAYNAFCESQGWQAVTVRQFESQVCDHMISVHHAHKRTDIQRTDKNQRG